MKNIIPFLILAAVIFVLTRSLMNNTSHQYPSPLNNRQIPAFVLSTIKYPYYTFTQQELTGKVSLLTFWATWCEACDVEHKMLLKIKNQYHIPIYGILYKDDATKAQTYLDQKGNPFVKVGNDTQGNVAIDFGIYGTPETYIIDRYGNILYTHVGSITESIWHETLLPIIKKNS